MYRSGDGNRFLAVREFGLFADSRFYLQVGLVYLQAHSPIRCLKNFTDKAVAPQKKRHINGTFL
ncbi:hypothetical protein KIS4809_0197 [Bacillus sp. ZZV12-4809]|nr:hypothetical protein KIS4809_0197 [Bacillus sp. ZZV12-4809]